MTKQKQKVINNVSNEDFEEALNIYATADAQEQQLTAKLDAEITKLREKNADHFTKLKDQKDLCFNLILTYCQENDNLFETKKSLETIHGIVGFRTGTPKLKLRKGFKWDAVLELIKTFNPIYVRRTEEVDKQSIIADRNSIDFKPIGLEVVQDETFYIELKKETL